MIIKLGEYEYKETHSVISQLRSMSSMVGDTAIEQLEEIVGDMNANSVVHCLYPFTGTLETFEKALKALSGDRLLSYESHTLEDLKREATDWFCDDRWLKIDEIITLYSFTINGKKHFVEIL